MFSPFHTFRRIHALGHFPAEATGAAHAAFARRAALWGLAGHALGRVAHALGGLAGHTLAGRAALAGCATLGRVPMPSGGVPMPSGGSPGMASAAEVSTGSVVSARVFIGKVASSASARIVASVFFIFVHLFPFRWAYCTAESLNEA